MYIFIITASTIIQFNWKGSPFLDALLLGNHHISKIQKSLSLSLREVIKTSEKTKHQKVVH